MRDNVFVNETLELDSGCASRSLLTVILTVIPGSHNPSKSSPNVAQQNSIR